MTHLYRLLLTASLIAVPLLSPAQYGAIDRHARQAPDSLRYSITELVDYLLEPAESEREKARSLYSWLTHTITYDDDASQQGRRINQSIGEIMQRGQGICFDYALLYEELCRRAGLQCVSISGYSRPELNTTELPPAPNHAWNAIFLEGKWALTDPTWGAAPGQDALMAEYETDYFLTPPHLFLLNHLPAMPMWQLLPCPISPEVFAQPAGALLPIATGQDTCYHYPDSIRAFLRLPVRQQRLQEAEATYRFLPTEANQTAWAQAITDYAVHLSDQATPLQQADSLAAFLKLQRAAIRQCRRARQLAAPLSWQTEFYAGLLINQAAALNQLSNTVASTTEERALLKEALDSLEEAEQTLRALPEDNYYRQYAERQCTAYLEAVRYNIRRLE